ncbi:M23 family metallopeptidase [Streptomyces antarcticus]|uniref:M23 family metallopeptidase n=1 Tax=Streptomyces antarcticus TaxID=2996458 RepID=UPI0022717220|nr:MULTISPECIES: M23 family metallopeptidase [unclassified Streptomyces]MCY0944225.1 M23 family metallopeptidase [Streptomyces sp. H34-AA3]MCZ4083869.1 M23 family metallopeptidase [Streptomyces sp. H34-S5]
MAFGSRTAGSGKHRGSSRLSRKTAGYAGIAALAATGVVGSLAGPAFAADNSTEHSVPDAGYNAVVVGDDLAGDIEDQAESQQRAAEHAAAQAKAEADAKQRAAEAKRIAEAKAKAERDAAERAAREAERKRLNTFVAPVGGGISTHYHAGGGMWSSGSHTGIDFRASEGTSVHAVGAGTVVEAGWGGAYGNNVVIKHNDGTFTQYGHMNSLNVSVGQQVTPGQQIGLAGSTGNSSGPHLHFEARTGADYGSDIDPVSYLRSHGVSL